MVERVVKTTGPAKGREAAPPRPPKPRVRANLVVRLVERERVRKEPDRPVHMADVKIPGPG